MTRDSRKPARLALILPPLCAAGAGLVFGSGGVASTTHHWIGGSSGTLSWNDPNNWDNGNVPNAQIATSDPEIALIDDGTSGDRDIVTPNTGPITVEFDWVNPALQADGVTPAMGVNKITLGHNLFFAQLANAGTHSNTYVNQRAADTMVLDLNGFNVAGANVNNSPNTQSRHNLTSLLGASMRIENSSTTSVSTIFGSNAAVSSNGAIIGSGVHLSQSLQSSNNISGVTFEDGSILSIVGGPTRATTYPTAGVYDLNFTTTGVMGSNVVIRNDFTVTGVGTISFNSSSTRTIKIAGDFTDNPTTAASDYLYGAGLNNQIIFNGGLTDGGGDPIVRGVNVSRTGITKAQFFVGDPAVGGTNGRVELDADLSLTGTSSFRVVAGSILDLDTFDLTAPTVTLDGNTTLKLNFDDLAADTGTLNAGSLSFGAIAIDLDLPGTWTGEKDLVLMSYSALLSGNAGDITLVDLPQHFTYDEIRTDNGTVRLTNAAIVIPEPATAGLLAVAGSALLLRRRRGA